MEVQKPQLAGAVVVVVVEGVHELRRHEDQRSRRHAQRLEIRADRQGQIACEHVERVDVIAMDVRIGAAFAAYRNQLTLSRSWSQRTRNSRFGLSAIVLHALGSVTNAFAIGADR